VRLAIHTIRFALGPAASRPAPDVASPHESA